MARSNAKSFLKSLLAPVETEAAVAVQTEQPLGSAANGSAEAPLNAESRRKDLALVRAELEKQAYQDVIDEDADVTALFLQGNEQAFVTLYAKYETPLLLYLKRMLSDEAVAEDVFQETWIRIYECRKYRTHIPFFRGFLFRAARNLGLNWMRTESRHQSASDRMEEVAGTDDTANSSQQIEMQRLLTHALKQLPIEQREVFVLREYSGYSYAEIATLMGTTEISAKVRASRARLRLKKFIASWLGLKEDDDPTNAI